MRPVVLHQTNCAYRRTSSHRYMVAFVLCMASVADMRRYYRTMRRWHNEPDARYLTIAQYSTPWRTGVERAA